MDTANLAQIKEAQALEVLDGVTTNPSLMAKEGITGKKSILKHYVDICNLVDGDVSTEVNALDFDGMVKVSKPLALLVIGFFVAILTACSDQYDKTETDSKVVADLKSSNIDFVPVISPVNRVPGTWRWLSTPAQHVIVYIPTPTTGNATEQDYATKTQNTVIQINSKLTGLIIIEAVSTKPSSGQYIQVSYGTSYVPAGSTNYSGYCANVSTGPNLGNVIQPSSSYGINANPVYLNLGNGHCDVTQDIVTHEFGHALGLASHFNGFGGNGPAISTEFWDVLATLYGNPQATIASNIIVKRAAK